MRASSLFALSTFKVTAEQNKNNNKQKMQTLLFARRSFNLRLQAPLRAFFFLLLLRLLLLSLSQCVAKNANAHAQILSAMPPAPSAAAAKMRRSPTVADSSRLATVARNRTVNREEGGRLRECKDANRVLNWSAIAKCIWQSLENLAKIHQRTRVR